MTNTNLSLIKSFVKARLTSALVRNVDAQNLVIDGSAILTMPACAFANATIDAIKVASPFDHPSYKVANSIGWALKKELGKASNAMLNRAAVRVVLAKNSASAEKAMASVKDYKVVVGGETVAKGSVAHLAHIICEVADSMEATYDMFQPHADIIAASTMGFELHPFMMKTEATYEVQNLIEHGDDDSFDDEDDEAAAFLREMNELMRPADGDVRPSNDWKQAMESAPRAIYESISKEEWVDITLESTLEQWRERAGFGVWSVIDDMIARMKAECGAQLTELFPKGIPAKKVGLITKLRSKRWDNKGKLARINDRVEYITNQINAMDNDESALTIAAVSNAKREDDLAELVVQQNEVAALVDMLDTWVPRFDELMKLTRLDFTPANYTFFAGFDIQAHVARRISERALQEGRNLTTRACMEAALTMLGNPTITVFPIATEKVVEATGEIRLVDSELFILSYTKDADYTGLARKLSDIRYQYTIADKTMDVLRTFAAIHKSNAMKNKKVTMDVVNNVMDTLGAQILEQFNV